MQSSAKTTRRPGSAASQRGQDVAQAHLGHDRALGPAEMRQQHRLAALRQNVLDRRHDLLDPRRIGHAAPLHRHVHIDPHQHHLAVQVEVVEGLPGHLAAPVRFPLLHPIAPAASTDHAALRFPSAAAAIRLPPQITKENGMAEIKDPENTIIIELKDGRVVIELLPDVAPKHAERMKALARAGAYDNVVLPPRDRRLHGPDRRCRAWQCRKSAQPAPRRHRRVGPARPSGRVLQAAA